MNPDRDIERLFQEARAADERHAPPFASVLAQRRTAARASRLRFAMAAVMVMLAALVVWRFTAPNERTPIFAFTPGEMRVPTDYLLDMATYPRAGEIPRIGGSDWFPLPASGDTSTDNRRSP